MTHKHLSFEYTIRRSLRAKKTRLIVTTEKVEVVAPGNVSERHIHSFVKSKGDWVVNSIEKLASKKETEVSRVSKIFKNGTTFPLRGKEYTLKLNCFSKDSIEVIELEGEIKLNLPAELMQKVNSQYIKAILIQWMKNQARLDVEIVVAKFAPKFRLFPRNIKIKTQKSRWGSCGVNNDINLNWLLVLAPPEVLEYVVVHELCHIKERNHSARFWLLVKAHLPHYQQQRNWLKQNGANLMQGI